jgi:hypothetical protein
VLRLLGNLSNQRMKKGILLARPSLLFNCQTDFVASHQLSLDLYPSLSQDFMSLLWVE